MTEQENIFGILWDSPAVTLQNWLTYVLRFCIHHQESLAYHYKKGLLNETDIKLVYNISNSFFLLFMNVYFLTTAYTNIRGMRSYTSPLFATFGKPWFLRV